MAEQKNSAQKKPLRRVWLTAAIFLAASGIGYIFRHIGFPDTNIAVVYILAVLMTSWLAQSFAFGFIASILATFLFNYFFAEPIFSFSVNNPNYIVTLITMTITALITSTLTSHAQRSAADAREKEAETKAIYNLTNHLTDAKDIHDIAGIAVSAISGCFACNAACLCFDEDNMPENTFIQQLLNDKQVRREVADIDEIKHRIEGLRTGFDMGAEFTDWPVYGRESILGVIRIPNDRAKSMNDNDAQMRLLRSMIESTALAMDRFRATEQRIKSRAEIVKERYRANLLRAISHDIRTPLSGMIGTTEMLIDMTERDDPRYNLALGIQKDADWLHSLVENILNLTRLRDGKLSIKKQPEAVEEVIGGAVSRIQSRAPEHEISVTVPDELLFVPMDAKLIEQVIINLLDNAVKHTKPGREIGIVVEPGVNAVTFTVRDRGMGIRKKDLPNVFEMFYTSHRGHADARKGMGLGLAICETIVKAHGGSIQAHNRTDGPGAAFTFALPLEENADE